MKATRIPTAIESQAAEALNALLGQVSFIKTREIRFQPVRNRCNLLASIDVLGHSHRLACRVSDGEPDHVRSELEKLRVSAAGRRDHTTRVLIAPVLGQQARELCEQSHVGFLDLEGNARLEVDEVFIGRRSLHSCRTASGAAEAGPTH